MMDSQDLDDCENDAERARWLLMAPPETLLRDQSFIRLVLRGAQFHAGLRYLDDEISFMREPRREDGWPAQIIAIAIARGRLNRVASGLDPLKLGA